MSLHDLLRYTRVGQPRETRTMGEEVTPGMAWWCRGGGTPEGLLKDDLCSDHPVQFLCS